MVGSGNKPPWMAPAKAVYSDFDTKNAKRYFELPNVTKPTVFPIMSLRVNIPGGVFLFAYVCIGLIYKCSRNGDYVISRNTSPTQSSRKHSGYFGLPCGRITSMCPRNRCSRRPGQTYSHRMSLSSSWKQQTWQSIRRSF